MVSFSGFVMSEIKDRLKELLAMQTPERGRFSSLEEWSTIPADNWKSFWYGRQRPTAEMIQFAARKWPEYGFWLATGLTDGLHGHVAVGEGVNFLESPVRQRKRAAEYFRLASVLLDRIESGVSIALEDWDELDQLKSLRTSEERFLQQSEQQAKEDEFAVVSKLEEIAADQTPEGGSLRNRLLDDLQRRKQLSDEQFANLLGISVAKLSEVRVKNMPLPSGAPARMWDSYGYVILRDSFLSILPRSWAEKLRGLDIAQGRKIHSKPH